MRLFSVVNCHIFTHMFMSCVSIHTAWPPQYATAEQPLMSCICAADAARSATGAIAYAPATRIIHERHQMNCSSNCTRDAYGLVRTELDLLSLQV